MRFFLCICFISLIEASLLAGGVGGGVGVMSQEGQEESIALYLRSANITESLQVNSLVMNEMENTLNIDEFSVLSIIIDPNTSLRLAVIKNNETGLNFLVEETQN